MASEVYALSAFPNGLNEERFSQEIEASSIVPTLQGVTLSGGICTIDFSSALSAPEKTTLNGLVANHSGLPPVDQSQPLPLVSPDGSRWEIKVSNLGILTTTKVS